MKIIIYHSNILKIGGCETFLYNFCKKLRNYYDILLLYDNANMEQLRRIARYVKVEKYIESKNYEADICLYSSAWGKEPKINANRYIQMIHADYKELNFNYKKKNDKVEHIAVSDHVKNVFKKLYPEEQIETIYNILDEKIKIKPILKLVSATRLSKEKGYKRMVQLYNKLKEADIKFRWIIFTDRNLYKTTDLGEEVIYMKPRYDIQDYLAEADYGVQLSDTEGYSYFINECLQYGTPVICTNFESAKESVTDGIDGYILNMDLSNLNIDKIINNIPKPKYEEKARVEDWINYLGGAEYKEKGEYINMIEIEVIKEDGYDDVQLGVHKNKGDKYTVSNERAVVILNTGWAVKVRDIVEETKETPKKETKTQTSVKKTRTKKTK